MANYNITLSDGVTIVTVNEAAVNTDYSVPLVGQNATTYGDDVAAAFLRSLENFAAPVSPNNNTTLGGSVTALKGQLWFDTANNVLKINTGTSGVPVWEGMAPTAQGATTDSVLRWSGSAWSPEERVQVSATGTLSVWDAGTANVTFAHNGTDFVIATTSTSDVQLAETGTRLHLPSTSDASLVSTDHPFQIGLDNNVNMRIDNNEIMAINNGAQSDLNLQTQGGNVVIGSTGGTGSIFLRARAADAASVAGLGQIWVNSGDGELYFTGDDDVAHQVSNVSAGGTVGGTGANNQIATWSGASTLDGSSNLTYDGTTFQFNSSTFGQFIIDRVSTTGAAAIRYQNDDGVKGYAGFNDAGEFELYTSGAVSTGFTVTQTGNATAQGFFLGDNDNLVFGSGSDVIIDFNGTNMVVNAAGATEIQVSGADLVLSNQTLLLDDIPTSEERITFKTNNATGGGQIGWRDSSNNLEANIFYYAGLMTVGNANTTWVTSSLGSEVRLGNQVALWSGGGLECIGTQEGTLDGDTTRGYVYDTAGGERNIGFNETPEITISGSRDLLRTDVGKLLRKTNTGTFTITCPTSNVFPIGATVLIQNDGNSNLSVAAAGTLEWNDGSWPVPTGTRTLAAGAVVTVRKKTSSVWSIWGVGIS